MENIYLHQPSPIRPISATSAVDLTGTGLANTLPSAPSSPSLDPTGTRHAARRRSWGNREVDTRSDAQPQLQSAPARFVAEPDSMLPSNDDPFYTSGDDRSSYSSRDHPYSADNAGRYRDLYTSDEYSNRHVGPSTASLINGFRGEGIEQEADAMEDEHREDDEAHLTANMPRGEALQNEEGYSSDPEHEGASPRSRRRTVRYSPSPSPLKLTSTAMKSVSKTMRRVSLRVVNLAGTGLAEQIRLGDGEETARRAPMDDDDEPPRPDLSKSLPIRGRTLGFLGPDSKVRFWLFNFLVYPWTEHVILLLIVLNAVVLTIQAFPSLTLPTANGPTLPPRIEGYFHAWEDYALFALFVVFTLEAVARICVTGFLFDPEIPVFSLFSSPYSLQSEPHTPNPGPSSGVGRQTSLTRGHSITQRISQLRRTLMRPFVIAPHAPTSAYPMQEYRPSSATTPQLQRNDPLTARVRNAAHRAHATIREPAEPTYLSRVMRSETVSGDPDAISLPFRLSIGNIHDKTQRNVPYLRQSWNRIDFVAILSFWIMFGLAIAGIERGTYHVGIFRAMSVIRTARLLSITTGTTTILHSLKTARPLLTSVAYFVIFAMVLFSIIGVQSFNGSYLRSCILSPTLGEAEILLQNQFCGGHIDPVTLQRTGYIDLSNNTFPTPKGYICPLGQLCKETVNPKNDIESFDAIHYAALQVVIVASANGWSPVMYNMIDAEFFVSCFFFIIAIIVLNFWLINLFVAVITHTFAAIRSATSKSAFGAAPLVKFDKYQDDDWLAENGRKAATRPNTAKVIYGYTKWCWVILALASLGLQASRTVDMSESQKLALYYGELGITIAFDIELILRVFATLPHWRTFFQHGNNWLDTILAIGSTVIQLPAIQHSEVYPWFTIFQLARFYRVILVVPRMRPLLLAVFGNMYGLANMSLFLFLINYIAALVAVQLLRGDFGNNTAINFGEAFNAFLAMYQIFSSENWVNVLYGAAQAEIQLRQTAIVIIFISGWMIFANFIVLQMFIAVINENFEVAEEAKKGKQATHYLNQNQAEQASAPWLRRLNPYRWVKANPVTVKVENLPSNLVLPMQKALIQDFGAQRREPRPVVKNNPVLSKRFKPGHYSSKSLTALQKLFAGEVKSSSTMTTLRHARQEPSADPYDEEIERHLELLASVNPDAGLGENAEDEYYERRALRADFIRNHPTYDKVFWVIPQKNWVRQLCQQVVQPPKRERIFGKPYSPIALPIFQMAILLTVIGGIAVESVATPLYRRHYYATHGFVRGAWFDVAESVFGLILFLEFMIKVIADGFLFTPNAYLRSIWNFIDFLIMIGIIVNVTTGLIFIGGLTRITRSLKALRALRLITLIDHMRNTFESLIISGAARILDAAVLAILYMIPYAVWGLNIFAGKMNTCNDGGANGMADCINEYPNTILGNSFGFPVPRVWDNPSPSTTFSFDSFRASLLILFEIVSLEGWIDVMSVAMSITGENEQPQTNASQANAIFFVIYNLLGGVVILTLFVSIIINNFSSKTGTAFLTNDQRQWIDLQKLFRRQRPSKRPKVRPTTPFRSWCFDRAVHKHGWWTRAMTLLFLLHILALMTQTFTVHKLADSFRNDFFLGLMSIYILDVVVRWYGLGWRSFRANGWNLFDIVVSIGSFITTLIVRFGGSRGSAFGIQQLQKLFLVSIAFKLVQRTNSLNMLFKTAVASLPVIINLLGLWLILFIFFGILFVEVFGLTKWGSAETRSANYESLGSALVMLAFQSTGEGWNQYMHDFDLTYPRCTNSSQRKGESDCGSTAWAFALFIAWNLLSMYIFVNMFTGVVVENFSYVFQASGSGAKSISREQMRSFKKVWAELSNPKTGYLERQNFTAFFGKLSGIFEVRVYPAEYSVRNILSVCKDPLGQNAWSPRVISGVDLSKVEKILDGIDYNEIRKRRAIYCRLYHEATISHEPGLGISFTNMLTLLAHHKLIVDAEALVLEDLVARTETIKLVTDLVDLDRVRSLLKAISERKKFLEYREQKRAARLEQEIPSIVVEDMPETPPLSSRDIASASFESPSQISPVPRHSHHDVSLSMDIPTGSRLQRSRRASDYSMFSADSFRSPRSSMVEEDPQDIVNSMKNSMWGDVMMEAAEEEKKRHNS